MKVTVAQWLTSSPTNLKVAGSSLPRRLHFLQYVFFGLNASSFFVSSSFLFLWFFLWFYFSLWVLVFVFFFFISSRGYSKFKNAISQKIHELKSSVANDISIISIPIKNLTGRCCGQKRKKEQSNAWNAWCKQSIEFYLHGMSKLGDHASFSGTLMYCNLLYKII